MKYLNHESQAFRLFVLHNNCSTMACRYAEEPDTDEEDAANEVFANLSDDDKELLKYCDDSDVDLFLHENRIQKEKRNVADWAESWEQKFFDHDIYAKIKPKDCEQCGCQGSSVYIHIEELFNPYGPDHLAGTYYCAIDQLGKLNTKLTEVLRRGRVRFGSV